MRPIVFGLVVAMGACGPSAEELARQHAEEAAAAQRAAEEAAQAAVAKAAEKKAAAERAIKGDLEYAATKIVEDTIKKKTWGRLPEKWYARGELLQREESRGIVAVRTGSKDGWLDAPLIIKTFCVALTYGDPEPNKYTWRQATAIQNCDEHPTEKQIRATAALNGWKSAWKSLADEVAAEAEAKKARRAKKRTVAADE